jgi:hypothetical protein
MSRRTRSDAPSEPLRYLTFANQPALRCTRLKARDCNCAVTATHFLARRHAGSSRHAWERNLRRTVGSSPRFGPLHLRATTVLRHIRTGSLEFLGRAAKERDFRAGIGTSIWLLNLIRSKQLHVLVHWLKVTCRYFVVVKFSRRLDHKNTEAPQLIAAAPLLLAGPRGEIRDGNPRLKLLGVSGRPQNSSQSGFFLNAMATADCRRPTMPPRLAGAAGFDAGLAVTATGFWAAWLAA